MFLPQLKRIIGILNEIKQGIYGSYKHKKISCSTQEVTEKMACLIGIEPTAFRLGGGPSILLRYRQIFGILARFKSYCKNLRYHKLRTIRRFIFTEF